MADFSTKFGRAIFNAWDNFLTTRDKIPVCDLCGYSYGKHKGDGSYCPLNGLRGNTHYSKTQMFTNKRLETIHRLVPQYFNDKKTFIQLCKEK